MTTLDRFSDPSGARPSAPEGADTSVPSRPPARPRSLRAHPAWIVVAAAGAALIRVTIRQRLNTDVFWHLAAGNWMLQHHSVIRADVFSYTVHGRPWLAEEWGFEVLLAWMVRHVGPDTYWLLSGGPCVLAFVISVARWRRQGAGTLWIAVLCIPVAAGLAIGIAPRPQDLSYLFFALELYLLTRARSRPRTLVLLPPLLLVWANIHGSFVAGLGVLGIEFLASLLARHGGRAAGSPTARLHIAPALRVRDTLATLVGATACSLVNPHGLRLIHYAFKVATAPQLSAIQEWQSPNFHVPLFFVAIAIPTMLVIVALSTGRMPVDAVALVIWLVFFAATLRSVRFAPYLVIAFGGLAAPFGRALKESLRPTLLTAPLALVLSTALIVGHHPAPNALDKASAPRAAASWLLAHPGRVFSTYVWNDYLISRNIPVFIDGRTDLYFGTGLLSTYFAVESLSRPPDPVFRRWHVRYVLWPTRSTLANYLALDPSWRLVRRFTGADIFVATKPRA